MDVIEAIYHRRSVRAFTTDAVPSEVIDDLVSAAVQAPSAMNLQPWAFLIIEGRETLSQFSERAKRHLLETMTPDSPLFPLSRSVIETGVRHLLWRLCADRDRLDLRCGSIRRGLLPGGAKPDARRVRYGPRYLLHRFCTPLAQSG